MRPRLRVGGFSGGVYLITRYTIKPNNLMVAHTKYDVTEEFEHCVCEYLASLAGEETSGLGDGLDILVARVNARNIESQAAKVPPGAPREYQGGS